MGLTRRKTIHLEDHQVTTDPTPRAKPAPAVPDALLAQWRDAAWADCMSNHHAFDCHIASSAAAWAWSQREEEVREAEQRGADAELEACVELLPSDFTIDGQTLREARRPAPPTLRERAVMALQARLDDTATVRGSYDRDAMELALQALQQNTDG